MDEAAATTAKDDHGDQIDAGFLQDVLAGLGAMPKTMAPKYFYDAAGAALFGDICELPEYYVTRTEIGILRANGAAMAEAIGTAAMLIEFGAGSLDKIRILLDVLKAPAGVAAVDISEHQLLRAADDLRRTYPGLPVTSIAADFTRAVDIPEPAGAAARKVAFFPGSTIGNFDPDAATAFLRGVTQTVGVGGGLLIGYDLKKDTQVLLDAYDDAAGVTAAFNLNLLVRINRELGGNFDTATFRHVARYDDRLGRIEMHLQSTLAQTVTIAGRTFGFAAGETIHTENSYKYAVQDFDALAAAAGMQRQALWSDADEYFAVALYGC